MPRYLARLDPARDLLLRDFFSGIAKRQARQQLKAAGSKVAGSSSRSSASAHAKLLDCLNLIDNIGGADETRLQRHTLLEAKNLLEAILDCAYKSLADDPQDKTRRPSLACCHFLLALPQRAASRSAGVVISSYLKRADETVMPPREFAQVTRLLLALAHGEQL